ncbi:MAG: hypothetical protein JW751_28560 [Polyangiaceae bacterium]|nr:hypothetical protein [Polyangiaceae bacterium]
MVDRRDYTVQHPEVKPLVSALKKRTVRRASKAPTTVDLRPWCSPIEDQEQLGSCTAHAAVGIVEYFERRALGKHIDGSRLFVYKTTRNLIGVSGDTGAWLRNAMGALVLCGVPGERYWPYTDRDPEFDREPPPFVYAIADNFEAIRYFAHDPLGGGLARTAVLESLKAFLGIQVPAMFGFWGYGTFDYGDEPGHIPLPSAAEMSGDPSWGHAVIAVGYDDKRKITNTLTNQTTTGALLIRNSWGVGWGDGGYGWMPYEYVLRGIALDFWSLLSTKWADTEQFLD